MTQSMTENESRLRQYIHYIRSGDFEKITNLPEYTHEQKLEIYIFAVENSPRAFEYIPQEFYDSLSEEEYVDLLESSVKYNSALGYIPLNYITPELCKIAVEKDGRELRFVPFELITSELCNLAISENGLAFEFVPREFMTQEICDSAVKEYGCFLMDVPREFITQEMCNIAVEHSYHFFEYVPHEFRTKSLLQTTLFKICSRKK
jgi:hypothetical protein